MSTPRARTQPAAIQAPVPSAAPSLVAAFAVFTTLLAGGSCGLIGHPLRHALTLVGLLAIVAATLSARQTFRGVLQILLFAVLAGYLSHSTSNVVAALSVVVLLGGITLAVPDFSSTLSPVIFASLTFALYRLAHDSIATVWLVADRLGHFIGSVGGAVAHEPLNTGATFSMLDALVLMFALSIARLAQTAKPWVGRAVLCTCAILATHLVYLIILARCLDWLGALPDSIATSLKDQIPWNLPILAAILHSIVAFFLLRWTGANVSSWQRLPTPAATRLSGIAKQRAVPKFIPIATAALAILAPVVCTVCWNQLDLTGKTVVFYKKGFLNWLKPTWDDYGRLGQGMYGLMGNSSTDMTNDVGGEGSRFLELYGANAIVSGDLSDEVLKKADALVMLYPDKEWEPGQLDRVRNYVKNGGTLLVFGEHTVQDTKTDPDPKRPRWKDEAIARFNDVLQDSNMRVRFDSAVFTVGGWLQSYESLAHPMTLGVQDNRNEFGVVIGGSVDARWPARPLIAGRFGNEDPGDAGRPDHAMLGNEKYDPGEKLGDVVLAAEQRIGKGRIVLFGDTSMMSNGLLHGCYDFDSRLLAYISNRATDPQSALRQILSSLFLLALFVAVIMQPHPIRITACALLLATSLTFCTEFSYSRATLIPGQKVATPKQSHLVYIDTSHMEAASLESWRENGLQGLQLCFEREGFMSLGLEQFTGERLYRARFLVSVAPNKPFTDRERAMVVDWVTKGGVFICTAGYDQSAGCQKLLADFGMYVGARPGETPLEPSGWFKSPYLDLAGYQPHVRFWAAWPLEWNRVENQPDPKPIAYDGKNQPVILERNFGDGKVVLVGDTDFAMNLNLELESGEPFEGVRENADFWHWFIEELTDVDPPWTPAAPATQPSVSARAATFVGDPVARVFNPCLEPLLPPETLDKAAPLRTGWEPGIIRFAHQGVFR